MTTPETTTPGLRRGDARWFFGQLAVVRATGTDTGGAYTLLEVTAPPGLEAPLHVHHSEDEGFLVLEGHLTLEVGEETVELDPGEFANGPRDIPHRFSVGPEGARMLWVLAPAGFEHLVEAVSVPAEQLTVPPPELSPPTDVAEIVTRFGAELL